MPVTSASPYSHNVNNVSGNNQVEPDILCKEEGKPGHGKSTDAPNNNSGLIVPACNNTRPLQRNNKFGRTYPLVMKLWKLHPYTHTYKTK